MKKDMSKNSNPENTMSKKEFDEIVDKMGITLGAPYSDGRDAIIENFEPGMTLAQCLDDGWYDGWGVDQEKLDRIGDDFDINKIGIREEAGEYEYESDGETWPVDKWMAEITYVIDGKEEVIGWVTTED